MRSLVLVIAAGLVGCAPAMDDSARATLAYMARPDVAARLDASAAEARRAHEAARPAAEREAEQRAAAAAIICRERGNMAATQPAFGDPIFMGMQQGWAAASTEQACLRAHQATGIMPSF